MGSKADIINTYFESGINELINKFKSAPTIFLEEKQIHNEFDRIIKSIVPAGEQIAHIKFSSSDQTVPFPLLMNEYTTVNHYMRIKNTKKNDDVVEETKLSFQNTYNVNGSPGSMDYVFLDKEWIEKLDFEDISSDGDKKTIIKVSPYNIAVNKDVRARRRFQEKLKSRFLVTCEFKFYHYGDHVKSWDELNLNVGDDSIKSASETIKIGILEDSYKQLNENPLYAHVVYFNSRTPIDGKSLDKLMNEIKAEIPKVSNNQTSLKIWFIQGGLPNRFNKSTIPVDGNLPLYETAKNTRT